MMETLATIFQDFDTQTQEKITTMFQKRNYKKGDYFVQEGKTNTNLAFIEKGVFQYFYNKDGDEITSYVTGDNNFMASLASFLNQTPATENIRAITDAQVWIISKKNIDCLIAESQAFKSFYIQVLEHQIVCIDSSRLDFIMLNAEERYEKLLRENTSLLQQVPLQLLASMLGVTPRHLSRIRSQIR